MRCKLNKPVNLSYKAAQIIALAVMVLLFFSCLSFNAGDFPSRYVWPNNQPAANWCGAVGA
ncbi:MAG: hypothetical protein PHQ00_07305, partial [Phycisphaerae bacterium]|nr:hypothetical protein [Phycisphaerae bacterium]